MWRKIAFTELSSKSCRRFACFADVIFKEYVIFLAFIAQKKPTIGQVKLNAIFLTSYNNNTDTHIYIYMLCSVSCANDSSSMLEYVIVVITFFCVYYWLKIIENGVYLLLYLCTVCIKKIEKFLISRKNYQHCPDKKNHTHNH